LAKTFAAGYTQLHASAEPNLMIRQGAMHATLEPLAAYFSRWRRSWTFPAGEFPSHSASVASCKRQSSVFCDFFYDGALLERESGS